MTCGLEGNVLIRADPLPPEAREWRRHASEPLTCDLIVRVGLFTGDVIGPNPHDGRDSLRSSADTARRRSMLVIIMRYRDVRIRHER